MVIHSTRAIEGNRPALNRSYSRPGVYFVEVLGVWNGESVGPDRDEDLGVKTKEKFPLDASGKFQPAAIVIPFENGTHPALPPGFSGPIHVGAAIPGDFRLALNVEHVTVFSGGSLHLPCTDAANARRLPMHRWVASRLCKM